MHPYEFSDEWLRHSRIALAASGGGQGYGVGSGRPAESAAVVNAPSAAMRPSDDTAIAALGTPKFAVGAEAEERACDAVDLARFAAVLPNIRRHHAGAIARAGREDAVVTRAVETRRRH